MMRQDKTREARTIERKECPSTKELKGLSSFTHKPRPDLRVTVNKVNEDVEGRTPSWQLTAHRGGRPGRPETICVYGGTSRTLPGRWNEVVGKMIRRAKERGWI